MADRGVSDLEALIDELAAQFERSGVDCERYATHISVVLLAGADAYKFKKAVDFGFLDFRTLEARETFCRRELTLNRRFAPGIYRGVVALARADDGRLVLDGAGRVLEYAVWMRRFASDQQMDRLLARGALGDTDFEDLGRALGELHAGAAHADARYGTVEMSLAQMRAAPAGLHDVDAQSPAVLARYAATLDAVAPALAARHGGGFIRDCHGDLHLSNIMRYDGRLLPFDCIEFNDELRYIDTASDFAFLFMDLEVRGATPAAWHTLNAWLAATGDYASLALLRIYAAYRSLVRAKVAMLASAAQPSADSLERARRHIALAGGYLAPRGRPTLTITHGLSGSGKSWQSRKLAAAECQVHLRSDVERRRLAGVAALGASGSALGTGLYTADRTGATYARLAQLSRLVLGAGDSVIVDASFLRSAQRRQFHVLADELDVRFRILDCDAPLAALQARVQARASRGDDPSEATLEVLALQMASHEPLTAAERRFVRADGATPAQS